MSQQEFATEICEALGLEPSDVSSIDIEIPFGDVVYATVEMPISGDDADRIHEVFKRYEFDVKKVEELDNTLENDLATKLGPGVVAWMQRVGILK